ncbi:hypothetical protein F5Y04DRAFT_9501 [Hypomontagnella monticulosa]|nr:hypothetical protein F5Y04DRAFT_9501 [Hypomontagnella monticulosa]
MSDYYQQYLSSVAGSGESSNQNPQDAPYQPQQHSTHMGNISPPLTTPYQNLGYFPGFPDPIMFQAPKAQSNRNRKKSASGADHVKHRRTRSGCYTCRSRRVKCDEAHPVCERCRKGKRDCVYPEPPSTKGQATGSGSSKDAASLTQELSPTSSQDEADEEVERSLKLEPIIDEEEPNETLSPSSYSVAELRRTSTTSTSNFQRATTRQSSETPSLEGTKSASPAVSTGTSASFTVSFQIPDPTLQVTASRPDWSHLPLDLQPHLAYYCEYITHYNYGMVNDPDDFFRSILPNLAIQPGNDALLNAVVGFSAYHRTVRDPNGKIQDFLRYYNKSVTLLLSYLKRREKQSTATLLTILQLATIEEYLGDWVNLMGHQKAALEILTRLFTPQTIMNSPCRILLTWYIRFDVFVGMMGGFETNLPRQWFSTVVQFCQDQIDKDPGNLKMKTELHASALRLISRDMSILYARGGRGEISGQEFAAEHDQITSRLYEWKAKLDPALTDPNLRVTDFPHKVPLVEDDIVDPYKPGHLYDFPLFSTTVLTAEWHSILVMHKSQEAFALQQKPSDELRGLAHSICEIFEAVQLWPSAPNGALVPIQACLAIAALFLPRDRRHHMWLRRKYALLESLGYVFPLTIRARMAEIFRDPSCIQWWLPNDEGLSPILRSIRAFADERNANPVSQQTESLREISAIFAKLRLNQEHEDFPSPGESNSGASSY